MLNRFFVLVVGCGLFCASRLCAQAVVTFERNTGKASTPEFHFAKIPSISDDDAGQDAVIEVIDGQDISLTKVRVLNDGGAPIHSWDWPRMYSFAKGSGRLRMDLGSVQPVSQINTFSWNEGDRAPQLYTVYGSDGTSEKFVAAPHKGIDPADRGWVKIATVDTRPQGFPQKDNGTGQYGVSITNPKGNLGRFRYLLWDVQSNIEAAQAACQYAEFDVVVPGVAGQSRQAALLTTGGKTIEGQARLDGDRLVIRDDDGKESRLAIDEIKTASFTPLLADSPTGSGSVIINGLRGEYFEGQDLKKLIFVRYDPVIHFDWTNASPDPRLGPQYSVRWTGQIATQIGGAHGFSIMFDGGVRVSVDGTNVIDGWDDVKNYRHEGTITLQPGRKYDLIVECRGLVEPHHGDRGRVRFYWTYPGMGRQMVAGEHLYPPTATAAEAARIRLTKPLDGDFIVLPAPVVLEAKMTGNPQTAVTYFDSGRLIRQAATPPYRHEWENPPLGMHAITAGVNADLSVGLGVLVDSPVVHVGIANKGDGTIPSPWGAVPLGAVPGKPADKPASYADGVFTLNSKAGVLHGQTDICSFIGQPVDGDVQITCRVNAFPKDQFGYAGLMLRDSLAGDAPCVSLTVGVDLARFNFRTDRGGYGTVTPLNHAAPCYLRLTRQNGGIAAYLSDDGTRWTQVYSREVSSLSSHLLVGLVAVGNSEDTSLSATIDHVEITNARLNENQPTGVLTCTGSFLAGSVRKATADQILLSRWRGGDLALPISNVARIIFHPLPAEMNSVESGHTGVLLSNGDFFDGEVKELTDGKLTVESVLFGRKTFSMTERAVLAAVLHDALPQPSDQVHTRDGSILMAKSIRIENSRLVVEDESAGPFSYSLRGIDSFERK